MDRVYLFGNGLSLSYEDEHYRLAAITERVQERLAEIPFEGNQSLLEKLEQIRSSVEPDAGSVQSFEDIAGPIDRLARALIQESGLLGFAETKEEEAVLIRIGVKVDALYRRVVGAVLSTVMDHDGESPTWAPIDAIAQFLGRETVRQGELDVFVLNYDALLDSGLIRSRDASGAFNLMDEFRGWGLRHVPVQCADGGKMQIEALAWREDNWLAGEPRLYLHHLHGAGTWMRGTATVFKATDLDDLRDCQLYRAWAEGTETEVEPVVLLGDQKERLVNLWPFSEGYEQFLAAVGAADQIVVAGYRFGDLPLNRVIARYRQPSSKVVVINPSPGIEEAARSALEMQGMEDKDQLLVIAQGLPEGLINLEAS